MKVTIRSALLSGAIALGTFAGLTAAEANVIRIGYAIAATAADQEANVGLSTKLWELMKAAKRIEEFHAIRDDKAMATGTVRCRRPQPISKRSATRRNGRRWLAN